MKQVKLSDVKKVLHCENNNDLVQIIMGLYNTRILRARDKGDTDMKEWSERRFNDLFDLLNNVGYYDDVNHN